MRLSVFIVIALVLADFSLIACELAPFSEVVLAKGQKLLVKTDNFGEIGVEAGGGALRFFEIFGVRKKVCMIVRQKRWYGSLGIYTPGEQSVLDRRFRVVANEGQMHFDSNAKAIKWLKDTYKYTTNKNRRDQVFVSDKGLILVVNANKERGSASLSLWQILVSGKPPSKFPTRLYFWKPMQQLLNNAMILNSRKGSVP